jgi:hypothetical protein
MSQLDISAIAQIITAIVAAVGLILSSYSLYLRRKDKQPNIRVALKTGWLTFPSPLSEPMLIAEIGNAGEKKITVTSLSFPFKKSIGIIMQPEGTERMPFELVPGKGATFWTPMRDCAIEFKREGFGGKISLKACFSDAVGNKYCSKGLKFDIEGWSKEKE